MKKLTRRGFLAGSALAAGAAFAGLTGCAPASQPQALSSTSSKKDAAAYMNKDRWGQQWEFEIAPEPVDESKIAETIDADIVVVGSGPAGLVAALSAAEAGADVRVITKSAEPIGGAHAIHALYSKVMEAAGVKRYNVDTAWRKEFMALGYKIDQKKWYRWFDYSEEAMNWLVDAVEPYGIYFTIDANAPEDIIPESDPNHNPTAGHHIQSSVDPRDRSQFPGALWQAYEAISNPIAVNTTGLYLEKAGEGDDAHVTGIIAENANGDYVRYNASKGVILATGDFSQDPDMMARYCPEAADKVGQSDGGGQKMGLWAGAAWQRSYPNAPMQIGGATGVFCIQPMMSHTGLDINMRGERFCNEDMPMYALSGQLALQPEQQCCHIWGDNYYEEGGPWMPEYSEPGTPLFTPEGMREYVESMMEPGFVFKAGTLEELIDTLGLPKDETLKTIERYNELCRKGVDEDFNKNARHMVEIKSGPFYGSISQIDFLTVMGGLRTDEYMRVCDADDKPIKGLFNVGTMVGDAYGNCYTLMLQGANMGMNCVTFGYLTGRDLANGTL